MITRASIDGRSAAGNRKEGSLYPLGRYAGNCLKGLASLLASRVEDQTISRLIKLAGLIQLTTDCVRSVEQLEALGGEPGVYCCWHVSYFLQGEELQRSPRVAK